MCTIKNIEIIMERINLYCIITIQDKKKNYILIISKNDSAGSYCINSASGSSQNFVDRTGKNSVIEFGPVICARKAMLELVSDDPKFFISPEISKNFYATGKLKGFSVSGNHFQIIPAIWSWRIPTGNRGWTHQTKEEIPFWVHRFSNRLNVTSVTEGILLFSNLNRWTNLTFLQFSWKNSN